jgi:hypothetical protein
VQSLNDCRAERLRHVADAEADDIGLRISLLKSIYFPGNLGKEIGFG